MGRVIISCLVAVLGFAAIVDRAGGAQAGLPDLVVYAEGAFKSFTVESGDSTVIPCKVPVGDFSVAPNGRFIVFSSSTSKAGMGFLYELDLTSGRLRQLPSQPFYFKALAHGERELYSDPAVSPDSRSVAFAVHSVSGNESDDLVGLSGPLAVMHLDSGERRVLLATKDIGGQGPVFVNNPVWSSSGSRILIAFEVNGAVVNAVGSRIQLLDELMAKRISEGTTSPKTWWSDNEVLFVWNRDTNVGGVGELYLLGLADGEVRKAAPALGISDESAHEVFGVQVTSRFVLLQHRNDAELFSRAGKLLQRWPNGTVRLRLYN